MKKVFTLLLIITFTVGAYSQAPQKMSYQAVVRDNLDHLVTSHTVGLQITILQGSPTGTVVYTETLTPSTNQNGLISIEIGGGAGFSTIDWSAGPYFLKTETDPAGGTNYTITGTSQLLSVPYALHAKTVASYTETDPVFSASPSNGISGSNISNWNTSYGWGDHSGLYRPVAWVPLWTDVTGKPSFSTVATSGNYSDLTNKPVLFDGTWASLSGKPTLSPVATSGLYSDLTGKPVLFSGSFADLTNKPATLSGYGITDAMNISHVANSITSTQVTNWNAAYGWGNHSGLYRPVAWVPAWTDVTAKPTEFSPSAHLHSAANITSGTLDIARIQTGTSASSVSLGNHTHGNITNTGSIGSSSGRIVTTGTDGALQATAGTATGQMLYWNGTGWVNVPPGSSGQVLTLVNGVPTWGAPGMGMGTNDVYNPKTGKIWMDRNLGATQVATSSTDASSYGYLYQWGRSTDGHQVRTSGTTSTLSSSDSPGHASFILSTGDWRSPGNDNLWQGVSGINNPCPSGYRLPTSAEWNAEVLSWSTRNAAGAFASPLKLPMAGYRSGSDGSLNSVGSYGVYWISTVSPCSSYLWIYSSYLIQCGERSNGHSVRCLKD